MNIQDSDLLFSAIASHLGAVREPESAPEADYTFWDGRTRISAAEMALLMALTAGPLDAEALAWHLAGDLCETRELLEALAAKGIIERSEKGYAITMATGLYCQAMASEWRSRGGEHRRS